MHLTIRHLLSFFLQLGPLGVFLVSIADDSFLFLPIGSDLLTVILVARNHGELALCVLAGAAGSTIGVFFLDLICRKGGEETLTRLVQPKLLGYLKAQVERRAAVLLVISCLAPPPFPFGAAIAATSALQYPKPRLLGLVLISRSVRFALVGWAAIKFGHDILRIAKSTGFLWCIGIFIAMCVMGSVASVAHWVRIGRARS